MQQVINNALKSDKFFALTSVSLELLLIPSYIEKKKRYLKLLVPKLSTVNNRPYSMFIFSLRQ